MILLVNLCCYFSKPKTTRNAKASLLRYLHFFHVTLPSCLWHLSHVCVRVPPKKGKVSATSTCVCVCASVVVALALARKMRFVVEVVAVLSLMVLGASCLQHHHQHHYQVSGRLTATVDAGDNEEVYSKHATGWEKIFWRFFFTADYCRGFFVLFTIKTSTIQLI